MSAPPLAVRLSGTLPTSIVSSADEPADDDAEADEDDVGLARRTLDVADGLARRARRPRLRAGDPQQVAAVDDRLRVERNLLAAADQLDEDDAAAVLVPPATRQRSDRRHLAFVTTTSSGGDGKVEERRGPRSPRRAATLAAEQHVAAGRDRDDVAGLEHVSPAWPRASAPPRRMRSTKTRSGANVAFQSRPRCGSPSASASAVGADVPLAIRRSRPASDMPARATAASRASGSPPSD